MSQCTSLNIDQRLRLIESIITRYLLNVETPVEALALSKRDPFLKDFLESQFTLPKINTVVIPTTLPSITSTLETIEICQYPLYLNDPLVLKTAIHLKKCGILGKEKSEYIEKRYKLDMLQEEVNDLVVIKKKSEKWKDFDLQILDKHEAQVSSIVRTELNKFDSQLKEWTSKKRSRMEYCGNGDFLSEVIGTGGDLMIIIRSGENVFGGYWKNKLIRIDDELVDVSDDKAFVFSLKNSYGIAPHKIERFRKRDYLSINCDFNSPTILNAPYCFYIQKDDCFISNKFHMYWKNTTSIGSSLFTGSIFPQRFRVDEIVVLKWID